MLFNYAKYKGMNIAGTDGIEFRGFADTDNISAWAEEAMEWAVSAGVITGSEGSLNPKDPATRAEVAAILQRFIENVSGA